MARHSVRVVFRPDGPEEPADFYASAVVGGSPMLDFGGSNAQSLVDWLGSDVVGVPELDFSPEGMLTGVRFFPSGRDGMRIEQPVEPMTADDLNSHPVYAEIFTDFGRRISDAKPRDEGENELLNRLREQWRAWTSSEADPCGNPPQLGYWFKFVDPETGAWRALWCWGYVPDPLAPGLPISFCDNLSCSSLFLHRGVAEGARLRCPHCTKGRAFTPAASAPSLTPGPGAMRKSRRNLNPWIAAAAVLLALGIGWSLLNKKDKQDDPGNGDGHLAQLNQQKKKPGEPTDTTTGGMPKDRTGGPSKNGDTGSAAGATGGTPKDRTGGPSRNGDTGSAAGATGGTPRDPTGDSGKGNAEGSATDRTGATDDRTGGASEIRSGDSSKVTTSGATTDSTGGAAENQTGTTKNRAGNSAKDTTGGASEIRSGGSAENQTGGTTKNRAGGTSKGSSSSAQEKRAGGTSKGSSSSAQEKRAGASSDESTSGVDEEGATSAKEKRAGASSNESTGSAKEKRAGASSTESNGSAKEKRSDGSSETTGGSAKNMTGGASEKRAGGSSKESSGASAKDLNSGAATDRTGDARAGTSGGPATIIVASPPPGQPDLKIIPLKPQKEGDGYVIPLRIEGEVSGSSRYRLSNPNDPNAAADWVKPKLGADGCYSVEVKSRPQARSKENAYQFLLEEITNKEAVSSRDVSIRIRESVEAELIGPKSKTP